jgi:hypothetical protein
MLISSPRLLNACIHTIYLTNARLICLSDVGAAGTFFAAMLFGNETIAHDKGKPVARRGRKAKSLSVSAESMEIGRRAGRSSGCRRRSEIVRALSSHAPNVPAEEQRGIIFNPLPDMFAPAVACAGPSAPTGTTGYSRPLCDRRFLFLHRIPSSLFSHPVPADQSSSHSGERRVLASAATFAAKIAFIRRSPFLPPGPQREGLSSTN